MTTEVTFEGELRHRSAPSLRVAAGLAATSFVSFALVDPLLVDGSVRDLLIVRGIGIALLAALAATTALGDGFLRWSRAITVATCVVTSLTVIVLSLLTGGGMSQYHQALLITFFAFALFPLPWTSTVAGAVFASMVVVYELVMVANEATGPLGTWATNNAILWAGALIATAMVHYGMRLRRGDFENRQRLAAAKERLEALDRAKSHFFANVSHELRTPLTLALAPVQALLERADQLSDPQVQNLRLVERNALRLLRLVDDLLELSRAEAASLRLRPKPLVVTDLVAQLVAQAAPLAARKQIELAAAEGPDCRLISADADHVERVLLNLIGNAVRFTPEGGAITITVQDTEIGVRVDVDDTGIGIPEDELDKVFERFHQVDASSTRAHGGTGIGLALVRELIELHGGTVRAERRPEGGTRVTFELPVSDLPASTQRPVTEPGAAVPGAADSGGLPEWHAALRRQDGYRLRQIRDATERRLAPRAPAGSRAHTVLIVEDNPDMVRFVGALLSADAHILTATDGITGLKLAHERRPDLVVSDVMMPGITGFELVSRLRDDPATADIPVLLMTARGTSEDRLEGRSKGADAYLSKPFQAAELTAAVRALLGRKSAQQDRARRRDAESIGYLAGGLTEELRGPLEAIDSSLADESNPPDLKSVREELARLRTAIDELERFALKPAGPLVDAPLRQAVQRAIAALGDQAQGHRLVVDVDEATRVRSAHGDIESVVSHLLSNALHATRGGGLIQVRASRSGTQVLLAVIDEGPGVPAAQAERIFAPYYTTRDGARGMGLAVARRIAERNAGGLELVPTGTGATFVLRLPVLGP